MSEVIAFIVGLIIGGLFEWVITRKFAKPKSMGVLSVNSAIGDEK